MPIVLQKTVAPSHCKHVVDVASGHKREKSTNNGESRRCRRAPMHAVKCRGIAMAL